METEEKQMMIECIIEMMNTLPIDKIRCIYFFVHAMFIGRK